MAMYWPSMVKYGHVFGRIAKCSQVWPDIGQVWLSMVKYGQVLAKVWPSMANYGQLLANTWQILGHTWPYLTILGHT